VNEIIQLGWIDWLDLFARFLMLSLLSIGGTVATLPDMHRYLVDQHRWLTGSQFTASITIAQAAPGPNVLFVALMGWNVGANAGGALTGLLGTLVCMVGILLPSSTVTYLAARWGHRNREVRAVRGFKQGMAPIVIALLIATSWVMASGHHNAVEDWPLWLLTAVAVLLIWRTQIHLLWLICAGAALGYFGIV
jgi:chromate transporter